jgi:glucosamine 6-phosphate synthetase-like amidotransferase/phosphosugar isomerase protein
MCGIAGFHVKDPSVIKKHEAVELFVDELLKGIEHRGKHATGFVSVGRDGKVVLDKAAKEATEFIKDRSRIPEGVRTVLLHTRYATLGAKENQENNHPVVYGSCFATHNGHINNHQEVYDELDLTRNAEVDSSVIAAAAHFHGVGELAEIRSTLEAMEGAMACAIINPVTHPGRVILAKGLGSPLYIVDTPKFIVWASTIDTIKNAWGTVLGTPPNTKKIENISEGNFIVVDDGDVTRDKFTVKRRPFVSNFNRDVIPRKNGPQHGGMGAGSASGSTRKRP